MRAVLSLCLALCFLAPSWGQASPSPPAGPAFGISESELARLKVISSRLAVISVELGTKLEASEATLTRLSSELEGLRTELSGLRSSFEASETRSAGLEEMLAKSESSLERLTASFEAYKRGVEAEIQRARSEARVWKFAAAICVVIGSAGLIHGLR